MGALFTTALSALFDNRAVNPSVWLAVTAMLLMAAMFITVVGRRWLDPVIVEIEVMPGRVVGWMLMTPFIVPLVALVCAITIVGAPLIVVELLLIPVATIIGYTATAHIVGAQLLRLAGVIPKPWIAVIGGMLLLRCIRFIPAAGGIINGILLWFGFAATMAVTWKVVMSWYRRRLPDDKQFRDEQLIEWDDVPRPQ